MQPAGFGPAYLRNRSASAADRVATIDDQRLALDEIAQRRAEEQHRIGNVTRLEKTRADERPLASRGKHLLRTGNLPRRVRVDEPRFDNIDVDPAVTSL